MIKVEFCAETVAQLKANIFAYAEAMTPIQTQIQAATNPVPATPPKVEKAPKAKKEKPEPAVAATPPPAAPALTETPKPPPAAVPADSEVQAALVAVNDKHGIDKAIECLSRFGVKRGRELLDAQKADFVALCKSVM